MKKKIQKELKLEKIFITIFYISMVLLNLIIYGFKDTRKLLLGSILYPVAINIFSFL